MGNYLLCSTNETHNNKNFLIARKNCKNATATYSWAMILKCTTIINVCSSFRSILKVVICKKLCNSAVVPKNFVNGLCIRSQRAFRICTQRTLSIEKLYQITSYVALMEIFSLPNWIAAQFSLRVRRHDEELNAQKLLSHLKWPKVYHMVRKLMYGPSAASRGS